LIKHEIAKINKVLPPNYRIVKWAHLHKEFDPEESEFTRNRKLKRSVLNKHYDQIINAIYNNMSEVAFSTQIKHRDGRAGVSTTNIAIKSI
jgi:long-chain acyl-CoA synthetase